MSASDMTIVIPRFNIGDTVYVHALTRRDGKNAAVEVRKVIGLRYIITPAGDEFYAYAVSGGKLYGVDSVFATLEAAADAARREMQCLKSAAGKKPFFAGFLEKIGIKGR